MPTRNTDECGHRTTDLAAYAGLFLAAFAATILPMQSEAVLAGLLLTGDYRAAALIGVASIGNVLGSSMNWLFGRGFEHFGDRRWFPVGRATLDRAGKWNRRYGQWSLLLSWRRIIGDPLTVAAGITREPFARFLILVSIAKIGRYLAMATITLNWA